MHSGGEPRVAWPGGHIVKSDPRQALKALLARLSSTPTADQLAAAARFGLAVDGSELDEAATLRSCLRARSEPGGLAPVAKRRPISFAEPSVRRFQRAYFPQDAHLFYSEEDQSASRADRAHDAPSVAILSRGLAASDDDAHHRAVEFSKQLDSDPAEEASRLLLSGSARPHAVDGALPDAQRTDRWAPAGSLRQLEPELESVLLTEPLPFCNVPSRTDPDEPPKRLVNVPGPFTTAELIPEAAIVAVEAHGRRIADLLRRAQRGKDGARVARGLRPEALILEEHEVLNECGRGYTWRKRPDQDLWDAVQPSSADHPPPSTFKGVVFEADAKRLGMPDLQVVSWSRQGFPGACGMPNNRTVIGYPHAGAVKNAAAFEEMNQRDIKNGFVTHGHAFPEIWPCVCDPMNLVVQHGKPRATIDKTMRLSSSKHPEPIAAFNDFVDLEAERERVPYKLVRVWQLSRATAILLTAGVEVRIGKFDLSNFFRIFGKQRAHVFQSGRVMQTLFGFDERVNFGERHAPDHTGRVSNALAFFVRLELRRLSAEYPSRCERIIRWIALRTGFAKDAGDFDDPNFRWACYFFFLYYVDDAGLACFADLLFDKSGEPVMVQSVDAKGAVAVRQQTRDEMLFQAAMAIANRYGADTPEKKQSPMGNLLEFLGIKLAVEARKRLLTADKRKAYLADTQGVMLSPKNPNGTLSVKYDTLNSLIHKLLHASEVVPIGRAHLFHLRKALAAVKHAGSERAAVFIGEDAIKELEWWAAQLVDVDSCERHGVPFATRFSFPTGGPGTVVHYGDASREPGNLIESGFGAWAVIDETFVFVEGRWTEDEIRHYSINVLEAFIKDVATYRFFEYACEVEAAAPTHSLVFCDNSTAESIAEFGRASKEGLHVLNARRQHWLIEHGVHQATERVASIHNDVADALSRGSIKEALRFPADCGLKVRRLHLSEAQRDTSFIPFTWA